MDEKTLDSSRVGLFDSLAVLTTTLVAIVHTRLELLSTDLEQDREHLFSLLVLSLGALFCFGIGILLTTILLVAAYWETHRLLVLGALAGFFLAVGMAAAWAVIHKTRTRPRLFSASLLELFKDRQQLESRL